MTSLPHGRLELHLHEEKNRLLSLEHFHLGHTDSGLLTDTEFAVCHVPGAPLCAVFVSSVGTRARGLGVPLPSSADSPGRRNGLGGRDGGQCVGRGRSPEMTSSVSHSASAPAGESLLERACEGYWCCLMQQARNQP